MRAHPVGQRPEQHVQVLWLDILVDRDDHLAYRRGKRRRAVEGTPHLGFQRIGTQLDDDQLAQVCQRFMHEDAGDAADVQMVAQMV